LVPTKYSINVTLHGCAFHTWTAIYFQYERLVLPFVPDDIDCPLSASKSTNGRYSESPKIARLNNITTAKDITVSSIADLSVAIRILPTTLTLLRNINYFVVEDVDTELPFLGDVRSVERYAG
jgi:hypothetical protein